MIWAILVIATILRLISLNQSLWLDEAINVVAARRMDFWSFVTKYPIGDFHPPGYFALLWIWSHLFGYSEISVRIPSVLFGVATIWLIYLVGQNLFNKKTGLIAALLLTLAPLHVYYSQEARMYCLATFSTALSFYFFIKLLVKKNKNVMTGYIMANVLVLYSDYLVYLIFPSQLFYLLWINRKEIKGWVQMVIASLIFFIPWLIFVFPNQLINGANVAASLPGWLAVVGGGVKELLLIPAKVLVGRFTLDNKMLYFGLVGLIGILYVGILGSGIKKLTQEIKLLLYWLIITVVLAFIISYFIPVLSYFRLLFILPAFYILITRGITTFDKVIQIILTTLLVTISIIFLLFYYINPNYQREDWRGAVKVVEQRIDGDSVILLENNNIFSPYQYYANDLSKVKQGLKKVPATSAEDINPEVFSNAQQVYLFEYLVDITDPHRFLESQLQLAGFIKKETLNFPGVGFVHHYSRQ